MMDLLAEYADKFEDSFPIFLVRQLPEAEIKELIRTAIKENKPYEADYNEEGVY